MEIGQKIVDDGVWKEFREGVKFKIGRAQSNEHLKIQDEVSKPYRKAIEKGTISRINERKILYETVARALILDWKGVTKKGKPVPYTVEDGIWALKHVDDLAEFITDAAMDHSNFFEKEEEEIAKK